MEITLTPENVNDYHLNYRNGVLHANIMRLVEAGKSVDIEVEIQTNAQFLVVNYGGNIN